MGAPPAGAFPLRSIGTWLLPLNDRDAGASGNHSSFPEKLTRDVHECYQNGCCAFPLLLDQRSRSAWQAFPRTDGWSCCMMWDDVQTFSTNPLLLWWRQTAGSIECTTNVKLGAGFQVDAVSLKTYQNTRRWVNKSHFLILSAHHNFAPSIIASRALPDFKAPFTLHHMQGRDCHHLKTLKNWLVHVHSDLNCVHTIWEDGSTCILCLVTLRLMRHLDIQNVSVSWRHL